jgi:hypothetical protein
MNLEALQPEGLLVG